MGGSGERDGEEYARNQRVYVLLKAHTGSNLADMGWGGAHSRPATGGELPGRLVDVGSGGHGEGLRGSRGDAAGTELGSSFVERIAVNTGTVPGSARPARPADGGRLGPSSTDRAGTGRSRRSTPRPGRAGHMGKGGSGFEKGWRL